MSLLFSSFPFTHLFILAWLCFIPSSKDDKLVFNYRPLPATPQSCSKIWQHNSPKHIYPSYSIFSMTSACVPATPVRTHPLACSASQLCFTPPPHQQPSPAGVWAIFRISYGKIYPTKRCCGCVFERRPSHRDSSCSFSLHSSNQPDAPRGMKEQA